MDPCQQAERVRQLVRTTFLQLGARSSDSIKETLLLRDGFYCGRRFDCEGCQAVWRFETNRVDFVSSQGVFVQAPATLDFPPQQQRRRAA